MRRLVVWLSAAALSGGCGLALADQSGKGLPLWDFYNAALKGAKYIAYELPMDHIGTQFGRRRMRTRSGRPSAIFPRRWRCVRWS